MSKPYLSQEEKLSQPHFPLWSHQGSEEMRSILHRKDYHIIVPTTRKGYDGKEHNSWVVYRKDIPKFIEQLFRQRINVEVEAIGQFEADIIFVSDPKESEMIRIVKKFRKEVEL